MGNKRVLSETNAQLFKRNSIGIFVTFYVPVKKLQKLKNDHNGRKMLKTETTKRIKPIIYINDN